MTGDSTTHSSATIENTGPVRAATDAARRPTQLPGNDVHDVRDGLMIYRPADDSVHHLNAMATLFYELADGRPLSSIARSIATIFELEPATASEVAETTYRELNAAGLVAEAVALSTVRTGP